MESYPVVSDRFSKCELLVVIHEFFVGKTKDKEAEYPACKGRVAGFPCLRIH